MLILGKWKMKDHDIAGEETGKPCPPTPSMPFFLSYTLQAYPLETCRVLQVSLLASEWPMLERLPYLLTKVVVPSEEAICIYKKLDQTLVWLFNFPFGIRSFKSHFHKEKVKFRETGTTLPRPPSCQVT